MAQLSPSHAVLGQHFVTFFADLKQQHISGAQEQIWMPCDQNSPGSGLHMVRSVFVPIAFGFLSLVLALPSAHAQLGQQWNRSYIPLQQQTAMVWQEMRECAQQAAKQFPDHTTDANAKREAARLDCLRRNHLPVTSAAPGTY